MSGDEGADVADIHVTIGVKIGAGGSRESEVADRHAIFRARRLTVPSVSPAIGGPRVGAAGERVAGLDVFIKTAVKSAVS